MKAKELRELIAKIPDDADVVVYSGGFWSEIDYAIEENGNWYLISKHELRHFEKKEEEA